ncbi:MAG: toxin-antitoxin system toxin subunit [Nitrospira bacterium HGW-Nitrospira-1]|nr:MAG: toxin-antitoxin system toxin subunit [Nitrospira bacterium HGW-Nitrospira-1]
MVRDDLIKKAGDYSEKRGDILLLFIFGSSVKGYATPESDVDIAILFKQEPDFAAIKQIESDLSYALRHEVDITALNNSSPVIRMQVLKSGILAVNKDKAVYNDFFVRTIKEYDDLKHIRKEMEDSVLRGRVCA